jgi:two-component system OmpR family response regulator
LENSGALGTIENEREGLWERGASARNSSERVVADGTEIDMNVSHSATGKVAQKSPKVLIVDDDPDVLDYLRRRLADHGYDVATASGGHAALTRCETDHWIPDLVVVDLVMTDMTGFQAATELRARYPNVKTLFISGAMGMGYLDELGTAAADLPFLQKPFAFAALLERIETLLSR